MQSAERDAVATAGARRRSSKEMAILHWWLALDTSPIEPSDLATFRRRSVSCCWAQVVAWWSSRACRASVRRAAAVRAMRLCVHSFVLGWETSVTVHHTNPPHFHMEGSADAQHVARCSAQITAVSSRMLGASTHRQVHAIHGKGDAVVATTACTHAHLSIPAHAYTRTCVPGKHTICKSPASLYTHTIAAVDI